MKPELLHTARVSTPPACYHCGESCREEHLTYAEKDFCCTGCQLVYQVLSEADMCSTYYALEAQPGSTQKSRSERENRFDYLLDAEVEGKLIDFKNERETHITFTIPLIHCASCIWLLENLERLHSGVISGRVDFMKKQVQIKFLHEVLTCATWFACSAASAMSRASSSPMWSSARLSQAWIKPCCSSSPSQDFASGI
ncbi:heavy metal translocating P-type ATPase metal-binding domain-containing protein [Nitritalea halalkaliphila]|uniref:heavy metal translocating P-type ATPase metal-binding domain-containing protein n=1 Tax=Nitritalea halalkaliphila TaxID=590849 RepID=UPI001EE68AC5|nr:heavy metal translocating P-type ATPase metal-binding domain-containing protein [Nitritalea halalkaliphila]